MKFYEKPALITGSREFLEAMGAENITPAARAALPWEIPYNGIYFGIAPAGTPICREQEQVVLTDAYGNQTGQFEAFTTVRDGELGEGVTGGQTVGYLETPQPLGGPMYFLKSRLRQAMPAAVRWQSRSIRMRRPITWTGIRISACVRRFTMKG